MATYIVERDSYAGFGSTGKYFGCFGLAGAAAALTAWAGLHGHLHGSPPTYAGSQLMLLAMQWIGGGLFGLMAVVVLGSLVLSNKARGSVTVDDLGVTRQIGERSRTLRWPEIEGFVVTPITAGITVIPRTGRETVVIPRFLDDYRGCVAEIKARGVRLLPPDNAQVRLALRKKATWHQVLIGYSGLLGFGLANDAHETHRTRLLGLAAYAGYFVWLMMDSPELEDYGWVRWSGGAVLVGILAWLVRHMMHTW